MIQSLTTPFPGTRNTMIGCVLVRRDPAPFIAVSFNQNVEVCHMMLCDVT